MSSAGECYEVESLIRTSIYSFANEGARVGKNAQLTDAALVVDALGEDAK